MIISPSSPATGSRSRPDHAHERPLLTGGYFTSLEGSNRAPCLIRWPGHIPAGKVSNEIVHLVDLFTTLVTAGGGEIPTDRQIDGIDMREFLLGDADQSSRNTILCLQGNRLQAVKWRQ